MNYLLNVDWLEFHGSTSLHLNNYYSNGIYYFPNGIFLQNVRNRKYHNDNYPYCFKICDSTGELGLLYVKALNLATISGSNIFVKIDNFTLYRSDFQQVLVDILTVLNASWVKVTRLDICYDTDTDALTKFKTLFDRTKAPNPSLHFRYKGKIKVNGTGATDTELTVGSLKSRRRSVMIYDKTMELRTSNKNYITYLHRNQFGFKTIYRVELRIMKNTLGIANIDVSKLGGKSYLEEIFNTYFEKVVQFSDIVTGQRVDLITLNNPSNKIVIPKIQRPVGKSINTVKGYINFMDYEIDKPEFRGQKKMWKEIRENLLKKYKLESWYLVRKGR
jgi:hypothetical protein